MARTSDTDSTTVTDRQATGQQPDFSTPTGGATTGGGGGAFVGPVTGTANEIAVANGSTAPALSFAYPIVLGTPQSGNLANCTGYTGSIPVGSITGLGTGVATALAVNTGTAGAFVVLGGALGTPSSGTVTNLTGTASININGTVGATTATTGAFTTATASNYGSFGGAAGITGTFVNPQYPTLGFNAYNNNYTAGMTGAQSIAQFDTVGCSLAWYFDTSTTVGNVMTPVLMMTMAPTVLTLASGTDLKLGRARSAGVLVQGGSITILDSSGATVTLLTT